MVKRKKKEFKRLPGRGLSFVSPSTLWAGPDHLVLIRRSGYTETYKRFYYADIQAVVLRVTNHRLYWNLVFGVPFVMSLLWMALARKGSFAVAAVLSGIWGFFLLVNTLRGPCCSFRVQTRINEEKIPMISRLRAGLKALRLVEERVAAVQGPIDRETLLSGGLTPPDAGTPPVARLKRKRQKQLQRPVSPVVHGAFMAGLGVQAFFCVALSLYSLWWLLMLHIVCLVALFVFGIVALARQSDSQMDASVRFWSGAGFIAVLLHGIFLFAYLFIKLVMDLQTQVATKTYHSMSEVMAGLFTHPYGFALMAVSAVAFLLLSVAGCVVLTRNRLPAPVPPPVTRI